MAPRDGTILTIVSQGLAADQGLGLNPSLQADLRDFNWVGNLSSAGQVVVTWHTSPTRTLADAMARQTVMGVTGAGSISVQLGAVLNNVIGTKFKLVVGYPDGNDVNLAMERGEVEGRCSSPWPSFLAATPHYVLDKLITPIVQVGLEKEPDLPDVPLLRELARTPQERQVLDFMSLAVAIGRPIATTPGVPAERVAALRKAFDETLRDPAFIADAREAAARDPRHGGRPARRPGRARDRDPGRAARAGEARDPAPQCGEPARRQAGQRIKGDG